MKRIVLGIDGSPASTAAVDWVAQLAPRLGGEVVAVHALEKSGAEMPSGEREHDVALWVAPLVDAGLAVRTIVRSGEAERILREEARAASGELTVLGRTGAGSRYSFLQLGGMAEYMVHHLDMPLAVVPPGWSGTLGRVVVGVDGSPGSRSALSWVTAIAEPLGVSVVVVQVEEPSHSSEAAPDSDEWERVTKAELATSTTPLTELGISVDCVTKRYLHPAAAILGVAASEHCDLIVIGTRGAGGFGGLLTGGVVQKVLHHTHVPLVLVPPL